MLDKIRMDQFAEGPVLGDAQRPHLRELVESLAVPLARGEDLSVIVLIENNGARINGFPFNRTLDHSVGFTPLTLPPMSDKEGVQLLSDLHMQFEKRFLGEIVRHHDAIRASPTNPDQPWLPGLSDSDVPF